MKSIKDEKVRKGIIAVFISTLIFMMIFCLITIIQYKNHVKEINITIENIIENVKVKYPNVPEEEIIELLNSTGKNNENILEKYGYTEEIPSIKAMGNSMESSIALNIVYIFIFGMLLIAIFIRSHKKQNKEVEDIIKYLNQINNKNYELKIEENGEDALSKLRNELYKTTILLKETAENSEMEKENLSTALADISHQLKTPLTSIRIMLDNINENPDMEESVKSDFLNEINKQVDWISSIVISLLKLARFDSGTIVMNDKNVNVKTLMNNVISNLSIMLEVKNIEAILKIDDDINLNIDYKWQLEALTNIVKNSIEHSKENSKIYIEVENSSLFVKIKITDTGEGISKKDLQHIFKRFYKAKKSGEDSIGIGLSLAKTIIEKDRGYIKVDSEEGKGSIFIVKYLK